jgi:tryptophan-rich sensory protein
LTAALSRPIALALAIIPAAGASLIGSAATLPNIPLWYTGLVKPNFTPPNWIFGPVWTALYVMMAVACFRILRREITRGPRQPIIAYILQSILNGLWSVVFFGLTSPALGLLVIAPLWLSIIWTMVIFWRIDRVAGSLFFPYIAWVSFAIALNVGIWILNS